MQSILKHQELCSLNRISLSDDINLILALISIISLSSFLSFTFVFVELYMYTSLRGGETLPKISIHSVRCYG